MEQPEYGILLNKMISRAKKRENRLAREYPQVTAFRRSEQPICRDFAGVQKAEADICSIPDFLFGSPMPAGLANLCLKLLRIYRLLVSLQNAAT